MLDYNPRKKDEQYINSNSPRFDLLSDLAQGDDEWLYCLASSDGKLYALRLMAVGNRHFLDPTTRNKHGCTVVGLYSRIS